MDSLLPESISIRSLMHDKGTILRCFINKWKKVFPASKEHQTRQPHQDSELLFALENGPPQAAYNSSQPHFLYTT